jgi:pyridoxine 4-dehydrogenase
MTAQLDAGAAGQWNLGGDLSIHRMGFGAMQLAGPGVFGPPASRDNSIAVLRRVRELGLNHIDTSDFYGPYVVNELIREALHPYAEDLVLVSKVGAFRDEAGGWNPALSDDDLRKGVEQNLEHLGIDQIHLVNLRMGAQSGPEDSPIADRFEVLAKLQQEGLIRHLGVSNVTRGQVEEARSVAPVAQVQNMFNIVDRRDGDLVDHCNELGIAYVPFFPVGGAFTEQPLAHQRIEAVAGRHGVSPQQVALAWLLARSPNILLIPGTSSISHLEQNVAAGGLRLTEQDLTDLNW